MEDIAGSNRSERRWRLFWLMLQGQAEDEAEAEADVGRNERCCGDRKRCTQNQARPAVETTKATCPSVGCERSGRCRGIKLGTWRNLAELGGTWRNAAERGGTQLNAVRTGDKEEVKCKRRWEPTTWPRWTRSMAEMDSRRRR